MNTIIEVTQKQVEIPQLNKVKVQTRNTIKKTNIQCINKQQSLQYQYRQNFASKNAFKLYGSSLIDQVKQESDQKAENGNKEETTGIRVRFAPSPTGNLHVGGARTALFNYLYAKQHKGKFILRVEDTDTARSTIESEQAVLQDLKWLGLDWDEGPDIGGPYGPYRQKERTQIYVEFANQLVEKDIAYPCFCSEEELAQMKRENEARHLPPIYRGKWAKASKEEVEEEKKKGTPYCLRFRVPPSKELSIYDEVRGRVTWNTNTLGDFVILRSSGLPVYNFCVAIDDALMKISHVIRAEEHLANTLRQVLIYDALEIQKPQFAHIALILAQDKSKLSKRHGATSVNQFKELGYQSHALVNYLSLLGWNDGTEQEMFTRQELIDKFSLDQITKGSAVFDTKKLGWMNAQYLKQLNDEDLGKLVGQHLYDHGFIKRPHSEFMTVAGKLIRDRLDRLSDSEPALVNYTAYPFMQMLGDDKSKSLQEDKLEDIAKIIVQYWDDGEFLKIMKDGSGGEFKAFTKKVSKDLGRKGKRVFMPIRLCLTGQLEGPDLVNLLPFLGQGEEEVTDQLHFIKISDRIEQLREYIKEHSESN